MFSRINPTLRGFLIIAAVAIVVMALNLYVALITVSMLLSIAFFLALAFFLFLVWRERRADISMWPTRARIVFYGAVVLIVIDIGASIVRGFAGGWDRAAFFLVLALCGFALWRVWRDQRTWV
jgi:hypothetical protein